MGMSGAMIAIGGANAVSSASNAYAQGTAIKMQGNYEKNQLQFNAQVADLQAKDAIARGEVEARNKKKEAKQVIGSQRAGLAAQGIEVNSDTASLIQQDTAGIAAEDVQTIKNNAWREAWGYRMENLNLSSKAAFVGLSSSFNAKNTFITGGMDAARSLAGGIMDSKKYTTTTPSKKT